MKSRDEKLQQMITKADRLLNEFTPLLNGKKRDEFWKKWIRLSREIDFLRAK